MSPGSRSGCAHRSLCRKVFRWLLGDVSMQGPAIGDLTEGVQLGRREGSHRVCGRPHADQRIAAEGVAERRHPLGPLVDGAVTEPDLHLVEGQVSLRSQPAVQVDRVEEGQPDPHVACRLHERLTHGVGLVVAPPAGLVVQVVEFANSRVARREHLEEDCPRQREVTLGLEPPGHGIHLVAPRPEVAAAGVGATTQGAVEGVRVGIRDAGDHDAVQSHVAIGGFHSLPDGADAPVVDRQPHPPLHLRG